MVTEMPMRFRGIRSNLMQANKIAKRINRATTATDFIARLAEQHARARINSRVLNQLIAEIRSTKLPKGEKLKRLKIIADYKKELRFI